MYYTRQHDSMFVTWTLKNLPSLCSSPFIHPFVSPDSIWSSSVEFTIISASLPFCCLNRAILAAVKRCLSATVRQSMHVQSLKRHWCLWPRRSDRIPWFLHRVHLGLRFDAVIFRSAVFSCCSSLISCMFFPLSLSTLRSKLQSYLSDFSLEFWLKIWHSYYLGDVLFVSGKIKESVFSSQ